MVEKNKQAKPNELNLAGSVKPNIDLAAKNHVMHSAKSNRPISTPFLMSGLIFQVAGLRLQLTLSMDNANTTKSIINNSMTISRVEYNKLFGNNKKIRKQIK